MIGARFTARRHPETHVSSLSPAAKAQLQIHFCVVLWGFTAILGKMISLPALPLVWWRMLLVVAALALLPRAWRGLRVLSPRLILAYAGIGALVALHWLTFYGAIKLANASVAATCMALATPFTALVEPALARRPFSGRELALGIAVLPGVALIVGGVPDAMRIGIAVGALSAFFVALFEYLPTATGQPEGPRRNSTLFAWWSHRQPSRDSAKQTAHRPKRNPGQVRLARHRAQPRWHPFHMHSESPELDSVLVRTHHEQ